MALSRMSRIFLIILDLALAAFIISDIARGYSPVERAAFWIGAGFEIALGYATYRVWMQSYSAQYPVRYKIVAIFMIAAGVLLPTLIYFFHNSLVVPAETTERFYILTVLTLLIYSSFIVHKYAASRRRPLD